LQPIERSISVQAYSDRTIKQVRDQRLGHVTGSACDKDPGIIKWFKRRHWQ
jgi:hypothetical protein